MLLRANQPGREDAYLRVLCVALACYAVIGKGFAYLGVPPLFVGEVLLLVGLWLWAGTRFAVARRSGRSRRSTPPRAIQAAKTNGSPVSRFHASPRSRSSACCSS